MKTDNYLALCLEQAANSPLHYHHGSIIVRGGKVIGQGYNDYRTGFNGGALKTGQIGNSGTDTESWRISKQQQHPHSKSKSKPKPSPNVRGTFTPFEAMSGNNHADAPLSMHSEMMAVHSALSQSCALASRTAWCQKPGFKPPASTSKPIALSRRCVEAHIERLVGGVCAQSSLGSFGEESGVQAREFEEWLREPGTTEWYEAARKETEWQWQTQRQRQRQQCV